MTTIDFVSLNKTSGTGNDTVQIICPPNSSSSKRNCTLTVSTRGGKTTNLTITQIGLQPTYPDAFSFNNTEFTEIEGSFSKAAFSLPCSKTISSIAIEGGTNAAKYFTQIVLTVLGPNAEQVFVKEVTGAQLPIGQGALLIKPEDYARITLLMNGEATAAYKYSSLTLKFGFTDGSSQNITFSFIGSL